MEALLNNRAISLVISLEFARKQRFKLKQIERPIYVRNVNSIYNKGGPIEHAIEINISYKRYRERIEINVIKEQKWNIILEMLWLVL